MVDATRLKMFTLDNPPNKSDYINAINAIRNRLGERRLQVLRFQFEQPGRATTSRKIRDHFGYSSLGASNLLYGRLGKTFAGVLPMRTQADDARRTAHWQALSTSHGTNESLVWIMRPQLASALVDRELVDPDLDGLGILVDLDVYEELLQVSEGRQRLVMHLSRERNRAIVAAKKSLAESLACEICGFDSLVFYGRDYCEVHHTVPIAELDEETMTRLDDLSIVCANCHRILHLNSPPMTMDELRRLVKTRPPAISHSRASIG